MLAAQLIVHFDQPIIQCGYTHNICQRDQIEPKIQNNKPDLGIVKIDFKEHKMPFEM